MNIEALRTVLVFGCSAILMSWKTKTMSEKRGGKGSFELTGSVYFSCSS